LRKGANFMMSALKLSLVNLTAEFYYGTVIAFLFLVVPSNAHYFLHI